MKDAADLGGVIAGVGQIVERDVQRGIAANGGQPLAQQRIFPMRRQPLPQLGAGDLVDVFQHRLHARELLKQLDGCFLANARDARDVVGGVAHETLEVDDLRRRDAESSLHSGGIKPFDLGDAFAREQRVDVVGYELQEVLVTGDNHGLHARGVGKARDGADDVIRLVLRQLQHGDAKRMKHLVHQRELLRQFPRRLLPRPFVCLVQPMAKRGLARVERHGDVRGLFVLQQFQQHHRKAVNRVCEVPVRILQRRQCKKSAVGDAVAVDQDKLVRPLRHRPPLIQFDRRPL